MKCPNWPVLPLLYTVLLFLLAAMALPESVRAECKELKIVEYEDRVEAVCVGEPPTEAEKKTAQAEQKRQEQEYQRQKAIELSQQREAVRVNRAKAESEAAAAKVAAERRKQNISPTKPQQAPPQTQPQDRNLINLKNM